MALVWLKGKICGWWGREREESCGRRTFVFFFILLFIGIIFLVESTTWFDQLTTNRRVEAFRGWVLNLMIFGRKIDLNGVKKVHHNQASLHFSLSGYFRISSNVQELRWCHFACGFVTHKSANNNNNKMVLESFALFSSSFKSKDQLTCYFPTLKNGTRKYKLFDCIWIVKYIIVSSHH